MKICPFCKEQIKEEAIKCRYCSSLLNSDLNSESPKTDKVTYILDRDLIRYAKFSISIIAILVVIGAVFFGFDLKQALRDVKEIENETKLTAKEANEIKNRSISILNEAKGISIAANERLQEITSKKDEAIGIVAQMNIPLNGTSNKEIVGDLISKYFQNVLTAKQLSELKKNIEDNKLNRQSIAEVRILLNQDINKVTSFFRQNNFNFPDFKFSIIERELNAYWDGNKLVFGMGMVNSEIFGPYESGIVFHELTHPLISLVAEGQSGAVAESICDVMAVLVIGEGWTFGKVRTNTPNVSQPLRSIQSPGEAYNTPSLGKDPQVCSMKSYVNGNNTAENDFGQIHINSGILNKAAYLISEGGNFGGENISTGIGRSKLLQLYVETIKQLPKNGNLTFIDFRDLIISVAKNKFSDNKISEIVVQGFRAVGL
jgi:hypothetical protein